MFSLQQNQRTRGQNRFCPHLRGEGQTMYTYVSKCKNDKIKFKKYKNNVFKDVIFICNGILFSYKEE
jgi:hypothetical protein